MFGYILNVNNSKMFKIAKNVNVFCANEIYLKMVVYLFIAYRKIKYIATNHGTFLFFCINYLLKQFFAFGELQ